MKPILTVAIGDVDVHVHAHDNSSRAGVVSCWSYVTRGLARLGQTELVLTLRRGLVEAIEQAPREPIEYLTMVVAAARQGRRMLAGSVSELRSPGFLGGAQLQGVLHWPAPPVPGASEAPRLQLVALTTEELLAMREVGPARVLGLLARSTRYWPYPPWIDRERAGVVDRAAAAASVLGRTARRRVPGLTVVREGESIVTQLDEAASAKWPSIAAALDERQPIALLADYAAPEVADACLVWSPGQSGPEAVSAVPPSGERVAGGFLLLLPGQAQDGGQVVEDGFAVSLTAASRAALGEAWRRGGAARVAGASGLSLDWRAAPTRTSLN